MNKLYLGQSKTEGPYAASMPIVKEDHKEVPPTFVTFKTMGPLHHPWEWMESSLDTGLECHRSQRIVRMGKSIAEHQYHKTKESQNRVNTSVVEMSRVGL